MKKKQEIKRQENYKPKHTDVFKSQIDLKHAYMADQSFGRKRAKSIIDNIPTEMHHYNLKDIPSHICNKEALKNVFRKLHIVDTEAKADNITGKPLGEGNVKVRVPVT